MRATNTVVAALLTASCGPGHVEWSDGEDVLRTALWVRGDTEAERSLLLSTAQMECSWLEDLQRHAIDLAVGACREDATHVMLTLEKGEPDTEWPGRYTPGTWQRLVSYAFAIRIEEAALDDENGLRPTYSVEEYSVATEGAVVDIEHLGEDGVRGTFGIDEGHISGSFRAQRCPQGSELADLLQSTAQLGCAFP